MKNNFSYCLSFLIALIMLAGCKRREILTGFTTETGYISITNVNTSAKAVNVYIDGTKANQYAAIGANTNVLGTYVGTTPGVHTIEVRDNTTNAVYATGNLTVEGAQTYSAFVFDVATTNTLKLLLLKTDRTTPDFSNAKIRFLNLAVGSPSLDVWLIRRLGGTAQDSSMIYSNVPYIGSTTPDVNALSAFKTAAANIAAGVNGSTAATDYIVRLKLAGTPTIVTTSTAITLLNSKIYTIYVRGTYPTLTISTLLHN